MKTRTIDPESSYNAILLSFPQCVCEYENSFIVIVRHGLYNAKEITINADEDEQEGIRNKSNLLRDIVQCATVISQ